MSDIPAPITSHRRAEQNRRRSRGLVALFVLLLITPLFFLIEMLVVILVMLFFPAVASMQTESIPIFLALWLLAPLGLLAMFVAYVLHKRHVLPGSLGAIPMVGEPAGIVLRQLENLSLAAGIPTPALFLMRSAQPNALAMGLPGERSTIVLTEGLLHTVDKRGLDGILAHELAHIANDDTRLDSTLAAIIRTTRLPTPIYALFAIGVLSSLPLILGGPAAIQDYISVVWQQNQEEGLEWLPRWVFVPWVLVTVLGPLAVVVWPALAKFLQSGVSRQREFLADAEGATLTRDPIGLARALERVSSWTAEADPVWTKDSGALLRPTTGKDIARQRGISHLCIVPNRSSLLATWFPTHPAASDRIDALERMAPPEPEASAKAVPDAELVATAKSVVEAPATPAALAQRRKAGPILTGFAIGGLVQLVLFTLYLSGVNHDPNVVADVRLLLAMFPLGIGGAIAAHVANRRAGRRAWWPATLMLIFGRYLPLSLLAAGGPLPMSIGSLAILYLALLSEPLAGAVLGAKGREGLRAMVDRAVGPSGGRRHGP